MPPRPIDIQVNTLTPIWTGNIRQSADEDVFATSILGGIRWWTEALLRGVGAFVPDPVRQPSIYTPGAAVDPATAIFGCTGYKRRFRLEVITAPETLKSAVIRDRIPGGNGRSWYFRSKPLEGQFQLKLSSREAGWMQCVQDVLCFMTDWAALGARNQMGFGVCRATIPNAPLQTGVLSRYLEQNLGNHDNEQGLPSLRDMFFARLRSPGAPFPEEYTFGIKVALRDLLRASPQASPAAQDTETRLCHTVFGHSNGNDRSGSRVAVSRPYSNGREIRVWGWMPRHDPDRELSARRTAILASIRHLLGGLDMDWHELPDTPEGVPPTAAETLAFYRKLSGRPS